MVIEKPAQRDAQRRVGGFTLIELMVVLAVIALLLSLAMPRYFNSVHRSKENVLRANLETTRDAIDKYYGDTGRYPDSLDQLVKGKYLRSLPVDPLTESAVTWIVVPPDRPERAGSVFNIHSGAQGKAQDGSNYGDW